MFTLYPRVYPTLHCCQEGKAQTLTGILTGRTFKWPQSPDFRGHHSAETEASSRESPASGAREWIQISLMFPGHRLPPAPGTAKPGPQPLIVLSRWQ